MFDSSNNINGLKSTSAQSTVSSAPKKELDQASFLKLLTMQLSYQDPFKPVDNAQMLSQMTSMSTSEGINSLSSQMGNLNNLMTSSQALQASALVGQQVLVPSNTGYLEQNGQLAGVVAIGSQAQHGHVSVTIEDDRGQVIKSFPLEGNLRGNVEFIWDGQDKQGKAVAAGQYTLKAHAIVDGQPESLTAFAYGKVDSVVLGNGANPTQLNLKGLGSTSLSSVLQIAGSHGQSSRVNAGSPSSI